MDILYAQTEYDYETGFLTATCPVCHVSNYAEYENGTPHARGKCPHFELISDNGATFLFVKQAG